MVCVPCIVIPFVLWVFHKFIRPYLLMIWDPWKNSRSVKETDNSEDISSTEKTAPVKNGHVLDSKTTTVGGSNKKSD